MTLIEQLALELKKSEDEVARFLQSAPKRYKVYTIPKRASGHRVIAQPSKELKEYQRKYLGLQQLPIHEAAMAYREGMSIKQNAIAHKNNPYLLKLDLENFFNSISDKLFWQVWESIHPLPSIQDKQTLENLLFWCPSKRTGGALVLSIGAPSSPLVSNFFMYQFDGVISKICLERGIAYTRYADDLTFSTKHKDILFELPLLVKEKLADLFGGSIRINRKKTKFSSKAHNRHVTGITINNDGKLSLGRERKRYIKHLVYQVQLGKLDKADRQHLRGLIAFAKHIEPMFIQSLIRKYSAELITQIVEESNG
ncbi:retron St85 family RNA-directed DNA polymerase [Vibrio sp. G41H]|uniref:retron St85 family RNA-directed DNA polymerase n=1 Tax=unclassified Vibrio TaxID=2614977 RepID=UPI001AD73F7F|nr:MULTISPECIES: retron St85 family RNA-directed DNA polymerase [unclassified Vibrio]MBO7910487.1 retron St85 family RNA-directed DNA polymerase [Vibrio sp. G41H]MCF7489319.1 retron St85 family RNA-directed DNA polymerase [Vibrio sp. G-C-1]